MKTGQVVVDPPEIPVAATLGAVVDPLAVAIGIILVAKVADATIVVHATTTHQVVETIAADNNAATVARGTMIDPTAAINPGITLKRMSIRESVKINRAVTQDRMCVLTFDETTVVTPILVAPHRRQHHYPRPYYGQRARQQHLL